MTKVHFATVLSPGEVREVTGYKSHSKQIDALAMMGIPHYVRPNGSPCVIREGLLATNTAPANDNEWVMDM